MGNGLLHLILMSGTGSFEQPFDLIRSILFWTALVVFLLFGVLMPALVFVAALAEKQRVASWVLGTEDDARTQKVTRTVAAAMAMEYRPLGLYSNGAADKKRKLVFLLHSEDGQVLLRVWPGRRYEAMSRLLSGHWLVTADSLPAGDLSGLQWEEMLPSASVNLLLGRHRERLRKTGQSCVPFTDDDAVEALVEHERRCVARLKELGLARYVGPGQETWAFTVWGAVKMAVQTAQLLRMVRDGKKRVDAREKAEELPLRL